MNRMTMKRCLFFAGALMMVASSSHALQPWKQGDGFYAGVGGGYGFGNFDAALSTTAGGESDGGFVASPRNGFGSVYVGYGEIFDERYYVAAEFSLGLWAGGVRSGDVNIRPLIDQLDVLTSGASLPSVVNGQFSAGPKQDFAIYSRVGYLLPEHRGLLYALLGWTYGVQTVSMSTEGFTSGSRSIAATYADDNVGLSAITYGVGLEMPVAQSVAVRIQYRYINYRDDTTVSLDELNDRMRPLLSPDTSLELKSNNDSGTHVMSLSLGYFF